MVNYIISYTADKKPIGEKVLVLNKFDKNQLQNKFDEYAAKMQPGDILEYIKDDLSSKKMGGTLLYVENEKGINYIYNLNNNRKKKYKVQPTAQPKSEAYGKSKITENAAKNNFTFEDDDETIYVYLENVSTTIPIFKVNKSDIRLEKYQNVRELTLLIDKIFFDIDTSTLTKDDFSQKLSGDGPNSKTINTLHKRFRNLRDALEYAKTKSINVGKVQKESLSEMIGRVIKEESATELSPGEVFVSFGSHRARDYATRALGELPNPLYSFTSGTHLYKVNQDQLAKLSGSKRIVMKQYKKLPKGEWLNSWKR